MSICTTDLQVLNDQDVMGSQTGPEFERTQTIFQICQTLSDPWSTFCLYPPNQGHMPVMCSGDPNLFFFGMLDQQVTQLAQLPRVISYPNLHSNSFFVPTLDNWLGNALPHAPLLQAFATSIDANTNLAIGLNLTPGFLLQDKDGLLRQQTVPAGINDPFSNCVVNGAGSVQGVLFSDTGGFVATAGSQHVFQSLFLPNNVIRTNLTHLEMLVRDDLVGNTFIMLGSQAIQGGNSFIYIHQYAINGDVVDPGSVVPYKQMVFTVPFYERLMWMLLSVDEAQIFWGIGNPQIGFNSYSVFQLTTANDSLGPQALCTVSLPFGQFVPLVFTKWYGFLPNTFSSGTVQLLTSDHLLLVFNLPSTNITVPGSQGVTPQFSRLAQRKTVKVLGQNAFFLLNNVLVPTPFVANGALDVYAITVDATKVNVIPQDGHYYQLDVASLQWTTSVNLDLFYANGTGTMNELQDAKMQQWFLGTSLFPEGVPIFNPQTDVPFELFLSRHQLFRLTITGVDPITNRILGSIDEANVYRLVTNVANRTQLYDNGVITVTNISSGNIIWQSATNDQEGSPLDFSVLSLSQSLTTQAQFAVASPNGRYMLCVLDESVDLVFNPFNLPRFTAFVENGGGTVDTAAKAQSNFCFQALNNAATNPLKFVDNRCTCLSSDRLASRVYPQISTLPEGTQVYLTQQLPCVMQDCQLVPEDEYTIANMAVGNRCVNDVGICTQFATDGIGNVLLTQDCGVNLRSCVTSTDCPFGANCRNGQCIANCSNDATCMNANPLARCVNGQCQVANSNTDQNKLSLVAILSIVFGALLLLLLLFVIYFGVRRTNNKQQPPQQQRAEPQVAKK